MELLQVQCQQLSYQQIQGLKLLQMSSWELEQYLRELSQENPLVDLEPETPSVEEKDELLHYLQWLEDNDYQNIYYQQVNEDELDPLSQVGTAGGLEETLFRFLSQQLYSRDLEDKMSETVRYLASCLDERGYLTTPLRELSQRDHIPLTRLEQALDILQGLEPAGVGAENLSQCLELQLLRIREEGPALAIVKHHLEMLARHQYSAIAVQIGISTEQVKEAAAIIRELDTRPGAIFEQAEQIPYILPDIFVEEQGGHYTAQIRKPGRQYVQINEYYKNLLLRSKDPQVTEYLKDKLQQAESVQQAVFQRESTLLRCAQAIVDTQAGFFRCGPQALCSLTMADLSKKLDLHESTVSRAVRGKYIQCVQGTYPLRYFFSRGVTAERGGAQIGGTAVRLRLKQLIDQEDHQNPLSDQKLAALLTQANCPISRRTVAKYREEMNIPNMSGRKCGFHL